MESANTKDLTVLRFADLIKDSPDTYTAEEVHWLLVRFWRVADKEMPMNKWSFYIMDLIKEFYLEHRNERN